MQDHLGKQKTNRLDSPTERKVFEKGKGFELYLRCMGFKVLSGRMSIVIHL